MKDKDGHRSLGTTLAYYGVLQTEKMFDQISGRLTVPNGIVSKSIKDGINFTISVREKVLQAKAVKYFEVLAEKDGKRIVNILNDPGLDSKELGDFYLGMQSSAATGVQGMHLRGHITHGAAWMKLYESLQANEKKVGRNIPIVDLNGCGGFSYITQIQKIDLSTFFKSTLSTGVGDVGVRMYHQEMLDMLDPENSNGDYRSARIRARTDKVFSRLDPRMQRYYSYYRYPDQNGPAKVFGAYAAVRANPIPSLK
jgi:hypothetical protein